MKKLLLTALGIALLAFVGCSKSDPVPPEEGGGTEQIDVNSLRLTITELAVTSTTYSFRIEASDEKIPYLPICVEEEFTIEYKEAEMLKLIMDDMKAQAKELGVSLEKFLQESTIKGNIEAGFKNLAPGKKYVLVAFGVNGTTAADHAYYAPFATLKADPIDCSFLVETTVTNNNVAFDVKPSKKDVKWYLCTMPKATYDMAKTENRWDDETLVNRYFEVEIQRMAADGMTQQEVLDALLHEGDQKLEAKGLDANTEYIWLAAAYVLNGNDLTLVSKVSQDTYTTGEAVQSGMTFELKYDIINNKRVHVTVTPSSQEERFIWFCMPFNEHNEGMDATELMNYLVEANGMWLNMMAVSGTQDHEISVKAGLKYYMIAFGYSGGVTTAPALVTFDTPAGADPATVTFETEILDAQPYSARLNFKPSDDTVYYGFILEPDSEAGTKEEIIEGIEADLQMQLQMQQMFNPSATMLDIIDNYWRGEIPYPYSNLKPGVTYTLTILTLNYEGKVAAFYSYPSFLTTPNLSDITTTTEIMGYFDGDQEAGTIFGQPEVTAGKAIIVLKYAASQADATGINAFVQQESSDFDALDPEVLTDEDLLDQIGSQWTKMNLAAPYHFIIAKWDINQVDFSYAFDKNGVHGKIARTAIPAAKTDNVGTMEELKALYDLADVPAEPASFAAKLLRPQMKERKATMMPRQAAEVQQPHAEMQRDNRPAQEQPTRTMLGKKLYLPIARTASFR